MNLTPYLKAIVGAVVAGLGAAEAAVNASAHHSINLSSGIVIAIVTLTSLGGVYATSNSPVAPVVPAAPAAPAAAEPVAPTVLPPLPPVPTA